MLKQLQTYYNIHSCKFTLWALWSHSSIGQKDVMRLQTLLLPHLLHPWQTVLSGKGSPPVPKIKAETPARPPARGVQKKISKYRIKSNQINARHWSLVDPALESKYPLHLVFGGGQTNKQINHHHHSCAAPLTNGKCSPPRREKKPLIKLRRKTDPK